MDTQIYQLLMFKLWWSLNSSFLVCSTTTATIIFRKNQQYGVSLSLYLRITLQICSLTQKIKTFLNESAKFSIMKSFWPADGVVLSSKIPVNSKTNRTLKFFSYPCKSLLWTMCLWVILSKSIMTIYWSSCLKKKRKVCL